MENYSEQLTLTAADLRRVQSILLELLCEVRRVCTLAGIRYAIIAGTLLGAVRHGGFIPWDDDADVALLREEYEAFRAACGTYLDSTRFYFQDHTNTPGYRWGYGKLRRRNSQYVVCGTEHLPYEQGIWIDIFPLDSIPEHWAGRAVCNLHCFLIRKLLYAESGRYRERSPIKRRLYSVLAGVPLEAVLTHYERYVKRCNQRRTSWVRILTFPTPNGACGYLRTWYEDLAEIVFEGEQFTGVRAYEDYLTFKFGCYLALPPPEQRRQHRVSTLKFPEPVEG